MNMEKLKYFIKLIDDALYTAKQHKKVMQMPAFYEKCKEAGWMTQEDIKRGKEYLEEKYDGIFSYDFLDNNIIGNLEHLRKRCENLEIKESIKKHPKGQRGNFGITRGISDYEGLWADELYNYQIYDACGAVEDYYNNELE